MVVKSPLPDIDIPKLDLLSYLFPDQNSVPDRPVWFDAADPSKHLSPAQLFNWTKRLGIGLDRLGVKHDSVVLIYSPNHIFIPVAYLGIAGNSRVFSAANPIYTVNEVTHQLKNSGAQCILVHPNYVKNAISASAKAGLPKGRIFLFNDEPCPSVDGVPDWREMLGTVQEADSYQWRKLSGEAATKQIATINYSSGTTGLPKGVCISHYNILANVEQTLAMRWPGLDVRGGEPTNETWVGFLPLYHAYGQMYANLLAAKTLTPVYIMKQFVYTDFLRCVQEYKITHLQVAPPVMIMLDKRPETADYDLSSLRGIITGGAPLSKELANAVTKKFRLEVKNGYGMTEVTTGSIMELKPSNSGTIGQLMPNHEAKLMSDDEQEVGLDTPGELWIRAPNVMQGYFKNAAATRESLTSDGWLKTGDVAVVNREGHFWIVDRKKELIKVNALQVAPAELEGILLESEDVADAAVTGVKVHDEEYPRAYVVCSETAKEAGVKERQIQQWMKGQVAKHKQLTGGVMFVDEIPKLASGKIQRKILREWAKRDAGAVEKELAGTTRSRL